MSDTVLEIIEQAPLTLEIIQEVKTLEIIEQASLILEIAEIGTQGPAGRDAQTETDGTLAGNGTLATPLSVLESIGIGKTLEYNPDGTLFRVTSANGTKTMTYNPDGTLASVAGTGIYKNKSFTYTDGLLTAVGVS